MPQAYTPRTLHVTPKETVMKLVSTAALALTLSIAAASAFSAEPATLTPQQQRMKDCNAQAGDKKGDDRKAFMSSCLKGEPAKPMTQQEKMKVCNTQAGDKKGDDRKAFMSNCLKGDGSGAAAH